MKRGPKCSICEHDHRAEIEFALANRVPYRRVAVQFQVSADAAGRHSRNHMDAALKARLMTTGTDSPVDLEQLRITESEGLLQHLVALRGREYAMLDKCEKLGHVGDFSRIDARLHKNLELTAKLLGDLQTGTTINHNTLILSPEYHQLRTGLIQALKHYPEAREAVALVLQDLERVERPALEAA
jgi:hypothetical protein